MLMHLKWRHSSQQQKKDKIKLKHIKNIYLLNQREDKKTKKNIARKFLVENIVIC